MMKKSLFRSFSHIYLEEAAREFPATSVILEKFPSAEVIPISSYKEIFNRPGQNWRIQKMSMKLILAVKQSDFLYSASQFAPAFGFEHFYYNTLAMNCPFDCHYCYLQGMYPSANMVLFVNTQDYFDATDRVLEKHRPIYLCISYDTDLMALESFYPYCAEWIQFAAQRPDLVIELRTKTANAGILRSLEPADNVILAWTISPELIRQRYEEKTPSLAKRVRAVKEAVDAGWKVRLCFDPLLGVPDWRQHYEEMVEQVFELVAPDSLADVSLGAFRMNRDYFKRAKSVRPDSEIMHTGLQPIGSAVAYVPEIEHELLDTMERYVKRYLPDEKVSVLRHSDTLHACNSPDHPAEG